jgi:hypothetical protein
MGTKHTPGPWRVDDERCKHVGEVFVRAGGTIVATVQADNVEDWETIETAMDDARLIASAPAMLGVIRDLVADFGSMTGGCESLDVARAILKHIDGGA